jgi:chromosome partitioning protein
MQVLCFTNIKGGVTKTTSTVNIGYGLAKSGYRVLVIDADPQSNTTYTLTGRLDENEEGTLYEVLIKGRPIKDIVISTSEPNLFLVPGSMWLCAAEIELVNRQSREQVLKKALRGITDYDYILIDTQPSLGLITVNAWVASNSLIVPVALTVYALVGIKILEWSLKYTRENMEIPLPIVGVIACLDDHTKNSQKYLASVQEYFGNLVFQTVIPRNIRVEEANDKSISLFDYASTSTGAIAYATLVKEVLARVH